MIKKLYKVQESNTIYYIIAYSKEGATDSLKDFIGEFHARSLNVISAEAVPRSKIINKHFKNKPRVMSLLACEWVELYGENQLPFNILMFEEL